MHISLNWSRQKYHLPPPPPPCFQCDNLRLTSRSAPKQAAKWMSSSGPPSSSSVSSSSSSSASLRWTCFTFSISSLGHVLKSRSNDKSNSKNFLQFSFSWHWSFPLKYYRSNLAKHPLSFSSPSTSSFFLLQGLALTPFWKVLNKLNWKSSSSSSPSACSV